MRGAARPGTSRSDTAWFLAGYACVAGFVALEAATRQRGTASAELGLRAWSMRTLGRSYTRTLRTEDAQHVVDTGPYAVVRHPGYAGSLLIWMGFALTSRSAPVVVAVAALLGSAYHRRIAAEEVLLRRDLPAYESYCKRTKKLVPLLW